MKEDFMKKKQKEIFIFCWIAYACVYLGRTNISVALPYIQNQFHFTKAEVGLIGSVFFWVYGIGQLINGYIGDKISSKLLIFMGLFIAGISNLFFGLSSSLIIMILFWGLNGYFQSMVWGPITRILSSWFPFKDRNRVITGISTSMVGGYLFAFLSCGAILYYADWKWTFWIPGIIIVLFSILWYAKIKNTPKDVGLQSPNDNIVNENKEKNVDNSKSLVRIIIDTKLWLVVIACFAQAIVKEGIGLWAPTFLMETQNLNIKATIGLLLFVPIMNFGGVLLSGWLNKKFKYEEKLTVAVLLMFGMLMIIGLIKIQGFGQVVAMIFLGLASGAVYGANNLLLGVVPMNYIKFNKVSTIAGFLNFCSYLAAGIATATTGGIVDKYGWNGVLLLWISICVGGAIALVFSWRTDRKNSLFANNAA